MGSEQEPDWDAETMKRWGKTAGELSAEAERGYNVSQMRAERGPGRELLRPSRRGERVTSGATRKLGRMQRFEVIDHRLQSVAQDKVRAFVADGAKVELSFQDNGQTLKIFISDE